MRIRAGGFRLGEMGGPVPTNVWHDGVTAGGVRKNLHQTIIIVDATRAAGIHLDALADYLEGMSARDISYLDGI